MEEGERGWGRGEESIVEPPSPPWLFFLSWIREKGAGEAGGCSYVPNLFLWTRYSLAPTGAQVTVLIATLIPVPQGTSA
jgi:hypothetical protein